jgi:hypothetical protein
MKKIFLLFATFLIINLTSCSTDDSSGSSSVIQINPPSWIQGKWLQPSAQSLETGWRFTSNDFIIIQANVELSQRQQLQTFLDNDQDVSASDSFTDSTYEVILNYLGGQSVTYSFTKLSDTSITWDSVPSSIFDKQ